MHFKVARLDSSKKRSDIAKAANPALLCLKLSGVFPYSYQKSGDNDEIVLNKFGIIINLIFGVILLLATLFVILATLGVFMSANWLASIDKIEIGILTFMSISSFLLIVIKGKSLQKIYNTILIISAELLNPSLVRRVVKILIGVQLVVSLLICGSLHIAPVIVLRIYSPTNGTSTSNAPFVVIDTLYLSRFLFVFVFWSVEFLFIDILVAIRACIYAADTYLASAAMADNDGKNNCMVALRKIVLRRQNLLDLVNEVNSLFSPILVLSAALSLAELLYSSYYGTSYAIAGKQRS